MTPTADAIAGEGDALEPEAVDLPDGETVILTARQHWTAPVLFGGIPTLALLLMLGLLTSVRAAPLPAGIAGGLTALALVPILAAGLRHTLRRYILTDRRVIVRDGLRHHQIPLGSVREVVVHERVRERSPGDVTFRSDQGLMVWTRAPEARRIARVASDAVRRYGRR